jgi:hypothetical protein
MSALLMGCVAAAAMQGGARVGLRGVRTHIHASAMGGHGGATKVRAPALHRGVCSGTREPHAVSN